MMSGSVLLLLAVTAERLGELILARRNTAALKARGAVEVAAGHYPLIVLLHTLWLAGLWLLAHDAPLSLGWLSVFGLLQILRFWTLFTLGRRWTTRIIVLPGETLVAKGPYRFLRHPNYVVVIGELAVLPLCFGMPLYALLFSALNAAILTIRIKAENSALAGSLRAKSP
ncbi:isoprenylcysteine carboxyl methyltransferase family protein [Rhizobium sp. CC-YZS058]|uniref:isoprenylcysteine carboxyl methyltransferase family protein n=1 Tax=Rhizobium sp. CC-YZS058 TaxID=3042153 RepID=UPI002B0554A4|nr:isoprenylcysteine carboxylmethyltransferase family protein [Rhizobium sp. CC-YZS058]MEA3537243.1 isoprenylcysteine carboxylmethyltransferase family protein [Rhizobium sp. CC-YZS058]